MKASLGPSPIQKSLPSNSILRRPSSDADTRAMTALTNMTPKLKQHTGLPGLRVTAPSTSTGDSKMRSNPRVTIKTPTKKPQRPIKSMMVTETLNAVTKIPEASRTSTLIGDNEGLSRYLSPDVSPHFDAVGMKQQTDTIKRSPAITKPEVRRDRSNPLTTDGLDPTPRNNQKTRVINSMLATGTMEPMAEIPEEIPEVSPSSSQMGNGEGLSRCLSPGISLESEPLGNEQQPETGIFKPEVRRDSSNLLGEDWIRLNPRNIQKTSINDSQAHLSKYL
jgi:hypothetical protein